MRYFLIFISNTKSKTLLMYLKPLVIQAFQCCRSHPDRNKTNNQFYPPQVNWDQIERYNTLSYSESGCRTLWRNSWAARLKRVISGMSQYGTPSATFSSVARSFSPKKGQCPVRLHKFNHMLQKTSTALWWWMKSHLLNVPKNNSRISDVIDWMKKTF